MNNVRRMLSLVLALFMAFSITVFAEETATGSEPVDENPVVAKLRDAEITLEDVASYAYQLYSAGLIADQSDYASALDYLLMYKVLPAIIVAEKGAENLLGSDVYAEKTAEAKASYEEELGSYITYYYGDTLSDEDYRKMLDETKALFASEGYPEEEYVEEYIVGEAFSVYFEAIPFEVAEEDVKTVFEEFAETDKNLFENDILTYEYYTNYYGYQALYHPAGYRGVTHILIDADADALEAYAAAAEGEDAAAIEEAKNKVIASVQEKLDEIYARIEAGESFESLIQEYNTDPGMTGDSLKTGYSVHKDSITYMEEFTAGAFSEKMQKVGDVSDPVVTSYGVHILYYLRDVPAGPVELDEELYQEMYNYLLYSKQDELLRQWLTEYGVEYTAEKAELIG